MSSQLNTVTPETLLLPENGKMPNSDLPVLIYRQALAGADLEHAFRKTFHAHHWGGTWVMGIYGYHHFHCNAHEALGIAAGSATLLLGGKGTPPIQVDTGDLLVLPAGTGHRRIKDSPDFRVVGAYPQGQEDFDEYTDSALCANYRQRLRAIQGPQCDPLYGENGPLTKLWRR